MMGIININDFVVYGVSGNRSALLLACLKQFIQRVSIACCYVKRCISYSKSVRLSIRHMLTLCQKDSRYKHVVFTGG